MSRRYLVTGGAGFIGSNFIRHLYEFEPTATITNLDAMTCAGVLATVAELDADKRHTFIEGDIRDPSLVERTVPGHDVIVHFAAESHVDRSIAGPSAFTETNVVGTGILIDAAHRHGIERFIHISTDEVYGSIAEGSADEEGRLNPSSPYSASKAGSDLLVRSYSATFGYEAIITRCTNNYGPYQFSEKVIPLFVTNLIDGHRVPLYGTGRNERDWLHVEDHCRAIHLLVDAGTPGDIYNIGADAQITNLELTHRILDSMGAGADMIEYVEDWPDHDLRHVVDSSKIRRLGWAPLCEIDERLAETIEWYQNRADWWPPLRPKIC